MIKDFPDVDAKPDTLEYGVKFVATRCHDQRKFFFRDKAQGSWLVTVYSNEKETMELATTIE